MISTEITTSAPDIFTQLQVPLILNVLDREVFVVTAIDLDVFPPDADLVANTQVNSSVSRTSRTSVGSIANSNVMAVKNLYIRTAAGATAAGSVFESASLETPATNQEFLDIVATNDFFVQISGGGNTLNKTVAVKVYGYRAIASADIFAALTQSELLSA